MASEPAPPTLSEVVGRNVRRLRTEAGMSQDQFARRCRKYGFQLTRPSVSLLESGSRSVHLGEFVMLLPALKCSPQDLLAGEPGEIVDLAAGAASMYLDGLRGLFKTRAPVPEAERVSQEHEERRASWVKILKSVHLPDAWSIDQLVPVLMHPSARLEEWFEEWALQEAERNAAEKLKLPAYLVAAMCDILWGQSLTAQRDSLLPRDASPAQRGHVTRRLLDDLEHRRSNRPEKESM